MKRKEPMTLEEHKEFGRKLKRQEREAWENLIEIQKHYGVSSKAAKKAERLHRNCRDLRLLMDGVLYRDQPYVYDLPEVSRSYLGKEEGEEETKLDRTIN